MYFKEQTLSISAFHVVPRTSNVDNEFPKNSKKVNIFRQIAYNGPISAIFLRQDLQDLQRYLSIFHNISFLNGLGGLCG